MRLDIPILLATAVSVSALTNPHQRAAEAGFGRFGRPSGHLGGHDHDVEKVHVSERERVGRIGTPASSSSSTATSTSSGGGSGGYRFLNEKTRRLSFPSFLLSLLVVLLFKPVILLYLQPSYSCTCRCRLMYLLLIARIRRERHFPPRGRFRYWRVLRWESSQYTIRELEFVLLVLSFDESGCF